MPGRPHPVLGPPIDVRALFEPERARLRGLLGSIDDAGWRAPTPCPGWSVHDVAAHVLGDDLGRLARTRDGHAGLGPSAGEDLPAFIDRINEQWVVAGRRLSPRLLIAALGWTGEQIAALWAEMPFDVTGEAVSWAGPEPAPVWLDSARDFTEYWVHRQQVLQAVRRPEPEEPAVMHAVIDTFMRALPFTLRNLQRPSDTALSFVVTGPAGGTWTVERRSDGWGLTDRSGSPNRVVLDAEDTWRLCVRMLQPGQARRRAEIIGDHELATTALSMVSIIRSD